MSGMPLRAALEILKARRTDRDVVVTTMGAAREWMAMGPLHPLDFVMVPSSMVRMIVSSQQAGSFGFRPHGQNGPVVAAATAANVGADASAAPAAAPETPVDAPASASAR
jgi:hypothetical protein